MRKYISLLLALLLLFLPAPAVAFSDLGGHWAADVIREVTAKRPDVIQGYEDGTVKPDRAVTRAEYIKMLVTGMGFMLFDISEANFADIGSHWAKEYIHTAMRTGILLNWEEGEEFHPDLPITREDMAKYTVRLLGYDTSQADPPDFTDSEEIAESCHPYVAAAVEKGLLQGYPDGRFKPKRHLNRAEAFAVIARFLQELEARKSLLGTELDGPFGNVSHNGFVALQDDWIYYRNPLDNNCLYKVGKDGSGSTKLTDSPCIHISVFGEWVYYSNPDDEGTLYRVRTDGTDNEKLVDLRVSFLNADSTGVYFINNDDGNRVYRIYGDGTGLTMIADFRADILNLSGEWLYFVNLKDNECLYKIKTDRTKRTKLNNLRTRYINVVGDWIYYSAYRDGGIYRTKIDGTETVRVSGIPVQNMNVFKNKIYFINAKYDQYLYSINLDGTDMELVAADEAEAYKKVLGWLY